MRTKPEQSLPRITIRRPSKIRTPWSTDTAWQMAPCLTVCINIWTGISLIRTKKSSSTCRTRFCTTGSFAAYLYDNRHLLQSFNFDNKDIYQAYLDMVFGIRDMKSNIDTAASVTADDKIITLSTCYAGMDNRRYLVQAVLVSIER